MIATWKARTPHLHIPPRNTLSDPIPINPLHLRIQQQKQRLILRDRPRSRNLLFTVESLVAGFAGFVGGRGGGSCGSGGGFAFLGSGGRGDGGGGKGFGFGLDKGGRSGHDHV